jgi:putative glutamine amidotransferase
MELPGDRFCVAVQWHPETAADVGLLAGLVGDRLTVRCHHHQSVETSPGFAPAARAHDGTLEAMELPGDRFCVAVQWHPETAADVGLLAGLVRAASEFSRTRDASG